jgi:hypothetical protein
MNELKKAPEEIVSCYENDHPYDVYDVAKTALAASEEWHKPDKTTPDNALIWCNMGKSLPFPGKWKFMTHNHYMEWYRQYKVVVLAKENQGPPPDDWSVK